MTETHTLLAWDTERELTKWTSHPVETPESPLVRHIGERREAHCPECRSIIYSRRQRLCGVCNQPLPEHLRFSDFEAQRVERLLESERNRHRTWMNR